LVAYRRHGYMLQQTKFYWDVVWNSEQSIVNELYQ
jgi:hypothetical protein